MRKLADELAALYHDKAEASIELAHFEQDRENRLLALTPAEGWPGKNEEQRKTARELTVAADSFLQTIGKTQMEVSDKLARIDGEISGLQVQFQAERWEVRRAHVEVIRDMLSGGITVGNRISQVANIDDIDELPF